MKIIIPIEDKQLETRISDVFGRAKYFLVYDSKSELYDFLENIGAVSPNGAGIKAAQQVVDLKADVVILPQIGKNGAEMLESAGIKIYQMKNNKVIDNIEALKNDTLLVLNKAHDGYHKAG